MSRFTYKLFPALSTGHREIDEGQITTGTSRKVVFTDTTSGDRIVFEGRGLDYDGGMLAAGKLEKMTVVDANGDVFLSMHNFKIDARFLTGKTFLDQVESFGGMIEQLDLRLICTNFADIVTGFKGSDLMLGRAGDDTLSGQAGRDILVGGEGYDVFVFEEGFGRDTIRDFDAVGGEKGFQDHIRASFDDVDSIARSGKHTVIDFGDGDTLTLMNIRPNQIDQSDFV